MRSKSIKKTFINQKLFFPVVALSSVLSMAALFVFYRTDFISIPFMGFLSSLLWFSSIVLWLIFIFAQKSTKIKSSLSRGEWLLLGLIALFALIIRLYQVNFYAVFLDDWFWLDQARGVLNGTITTPFGFIGDQPSNLPTFLVFPIYILTGKSYLAVRLTGIFFSIAGLILIFFLAKEFFNKTVAFFAAFFAATSIWDIHVSKIPWINTTINPLLICGSILFTYKALMSGSIKYAAVAGIIIGMSINLLYLASVHVLAIGIFSALFFVFAKHKKELLQIFLVLGFTTFLVSAPTVIKIIKYPTASIARHEDFINKNVEHSETSGGIAYYGSQFNAAMHQFIKNYDSYQGHVFPYWGITIEPLIQILFLIGLLFVIFKIRGKKYQFILLSFIVLFIPVVILERGISEWREYGFFSHIYLLAGVGLWALCIFLNRIVQPNLLTQKIILCLFFGIYLLFFVMNFKTYQKNYVTTKLYPYENQCREVADYLLKKMPSGPVYIPNEMCYQLTGVKIWDHLKYVPYNAPDELSTVSKDAVIVRLNNPNAQVLGEYDINSYTGHQFKQHILPMSKAVIYYAK